MLPPPRSAVGQNDFHPGPDRIAIGSAAGSLQPQRQEMISISVAIPQKPHGRGRAVRGPQIEVAVVVPIDQRMRAGVVHEVQAGDGGNVGELAVPGVQVATISLVAAQGNALKDHVLHLIQVLPECRLLKMSQVQFGRIRR